MDHCQNASEPEPAGDRLLDTPEPEEPATDETGPKQASTTADRSTRSALDRWADEVRQRNLDDALAALESRTDLDEEDRAAIAACSRAIVDGILRRPRRRLQADGEVAPVATELFDLDDRRSADGSNRR